MIGLSFLITVGACGPTHGSHLGAQPLPDPSDGRLAGLDQRLDAVPADVEPQEIEALAEGDDTRLVLVEGQTPGRQPAAEPRLGLERVLPAMAERDVESDRGALPIFRVGAFPRPAPRTGLARYRASGSPQVRVDGLCSIMSRSAMAKGSPLLGSGSGWSAPRRG